MNVNKLILSLVLMSTFFACTESIDSKHTEVEKKPIQEEEEAVIEHKLVSAFEQQFSVFDLFKPNNGDIVNTLAQEKFELALKKIKHYRSQKAAALSETQKANIRFMHIYALAGLVSEKKKTHQDLSKLLDSYKNKDLIVQHFPITTGSPMSFNQIRVEQDKKDTIELSCVNQAGINIHCFVRAEVKGNLDLKKSVGKSAYLCGKLKDYKVSPSKVFSWICDLKLSEGFIKILEDEYR